MDRKPAFFARPAVAAAFIIVAVALDQWIKYLIVLHLPLHVEHHVIWYFYLNHTTNTGVAFSFLSGMSGWAIDIMRLAIVAFILWWWRASRQAHGLVHFGFCMVISGAVGNIIDRFIYGHVIDYVSFHTQTWSFAIFNLADSLITLGAVVIGFSELFLNRKTPDKAG